MSKPSSTLNGHTDTGKVPGYKQIVSEIRNRIMDRDWLPGDRIPAEKELALEFDVCRATVSKSLKILENEGLLWGSRGKGRFVAEQGAHRKTGVLGIVLSHLAFLQKPSGARVLQGIQEVLEQTDNHLKICAFNRPDEQFGLVLDPESIKVMDLPGLDGVIILTQMVQLELALRMATYVPAVWFHHPSVQPGLAGIRYDWTDGAFEAGRHLFELGHRRVGLLTIREEFVSGREQLDGLRVAQRHFAPERARLVVDHTRTFGLEEAYRVAHGMLSKQDRPTALVCGSDDFARAALRAARELNLSVPGDLSLIGWNDQLTDDEVPVPMTSVAMDFVETGRLAARRLLWMLDNPGEMPDTDLVPTTLVVRDSTRRMEP